MENTENLLGVLRTLIQWRKSVLFVCGVAFLGSIVVSVLLPNYYKSTTLFLAASPDQAQPELLFGRAAFYPQYFGNENDIDRLLTIAESDELVNFIIDSFNLYSHYGIDSTGHRAAFKVREKFFDLYSVSKTKRDAIELSMEDKDRDKVAGMVNAARKKIDDIAQQLIKANQFKVLRSFEMNIDNKRRQLASINDSLRLLRGTFGIYNSEAQSEALTSQYAEAEAKLIRNRARLEALQNTTGIPRDTIEALRAMVRGQEEEVGNLNEKIALLNEGMGPVNILYKQYLEANQSLGTDLERYTLIKSAYESNIPATILVEPAAAPLIKSRPKRSIIVLAAVAIAFLFSGIGALLFDSYKDVNWREVTDAK